MTAVLSSLISILLTFGGTVLRDRWMPHNPMLVGENSFFYCDSMRGTVNCGTWKTLIELTGFVRGLAYDSRFFYVGHSMHRHIHRVANVRNNISIDAGIYMVEDDIRLQNFLRYPSYLIFMLYTYEKEKQFFDLADFADIINENIKPAEVCFFLFGYLTLALLGDSHTRSYRLSLCYRSPYFSREAER